MSDTSHANGPGAPSKYKPEYCELLKKHMADGLSYFSFAGLVQVNRDTLYEWEKVHKDWAQAKSEGIEMLRLFWEKLGVVHVINTTTYNDKGKPEKSESLNSSVWIYNMKVRFAEWREDKPEGKDSAPAMTESDQAEVKEMVGKTKDFLDKKKAGK